MDLQAANSHGTRASTLARLTMAACFATASVMLLASLNVSSGSSGAVDEPALSATPSR